MPKRFKVIAISSLMMLALVISGCSTVKSDNPIPRGTIADPESPQGAEEEGLVTEDEDLITESKSTITEGERNLTASYWLGEAGKKTIAYKVRTTAGGKKDLLNDEGGIILSGFEDYDLMLNLILARKEGKWGIYTGAGSNLTGHIFEEILNPLMPDDYKVYGPVRVKQEGLWGAIDQEGKIIIQPQYDFVHLTYYEEVEPFIKVEKDGQFGYVTREGKALVDTAWDVAFMDVLNVPEDIIFVKKGDEWGGIRVENAAARPVDWDLQPSDQAKLSFNNWTYDYQYDFYTHQIKGGETAVTAATQIFVNDYFSDHRMELWLLPAFSPGQPMQWGDLAQYILANTGDQWVNGSIPKAQFDGIVQKFFGSASYTYKPANGFTYKDGNYVFSGGFSFHGGYIYELTDLEMEKTREGEDQWKAVINGYYFNELDGSSTEDIKYQSKNAQTVWAEMKKQENKGLNFWQVRDRLVYNDPGSKLDLARKWTIEFTVNDPLGDLYFTYLSCDSREMGQ